ncbi:cytochrome c [Cytophagales bacterium LB-30]|uniref:Cytochrome c n=1 Tax=Shiella aurantiaca TaxID=3058365 RepID=A0ABT8F4L1_9BACT|nr:cytochrome c [Shiella aurantiaca]MDN4165161.1 cytochrome c [Shiella aurantiaca]
MRIQSLFLVSITSLGGLFLVGCGAQGEYKGMEFAPNMYHSVAYEPLTQIDDEEAGTFVSTREDGKGEFFNSNVNNPYQMNMREPVANTVPRNKQGYLPYRMPKDSLDYAAAVVKSPLTASEDVVAQGKELYLRYCTHCHGQNGQGSEDPTAKVGAILKGVPSYSVGRLATVSEGHVFHVITHGKGRMGAHGSQISEENRWKIVSYVQKLQKGSN